MVSFCRLQRGRCLDVGCGRAELDVVPAGITQMTFLGDLKRVMKAVGVARFRLIDDPGCHHCGGWVPFWK